MKMICTVDLMNTTQPWTHRFAIPMVVHKLFDIPEKLTLALGFHSATFLSLNSITWEVESCLLVNYQMLSAKLHGFGDKFVSPNIWSLRKVTVMTFVETAP